VKQSPVLVGSIRTRRLGRVWIACSARGLVAVEFGLSRTAFVSVLRRRTGLEVRPSFSRVQVAATQIGQYLEGRLRIFRLPIDWSTIPSPFQRAVLKAVLAIPYGQTRTYAEIARRVGHPSAPRAVGRANATNPMPLVIPCHRVIGSDGDLRGYGGAGGVRTKAWLIEMEASDSPLAGAMP
jgi:methylated-DNA-[protein]-cysteine S-methyltransferase